MRQEKTAWKYVVQKKLQILIEKRSHFKEVNIGFCRFSSLKFHKEKLQHVFSLLFVLL